MSYPLSSAVNSGDATLADHYNNLRLDAVHLGQAAADAVNLGTALERYESRLTLERLNTTQVRVPASATQPVSLIVEGYLVQAVANVDLAIGDAPAGAAAAYYVFAVRTASSTTFTLAISTSATELSSQRLIGRFYWDGAKIVLDSVRTDLARHIAEILYFLDPQLCNGRLTLSTGVPLPTSDVSGVATVYFTPYQGNRLALYVQDYGWRLYAFGELTLDISGVADDTNIDIFVYDNAGTLTLSYTAWSTATLRATALALQDGVWTKSGAPEYRYLGTIHTSAAGQTTDSVLKRLVWNFYNRIERQFLITEDTDSWTYNVAATWRSLNNDIANRIEFVIGIDEELLTMHATLMMENSGNNEMAIGFGLDKTNGNDANLQIGVAAIAATYNEQVYDSYYKDLPGIGAHYLQVVEYNGGGTTTYYGDRGKTSDIVLSGAIGSMRM